MAIVKPRLPRCAQDPYAEVARKSVAPGMDAAFCKECEAFLGYYCMSKQNNDVCQYLRHTTAEHQAPDGTSWVDTDLENTEVEIAMDGDEGEIY